MEQAVHLLLDYVATYPNDGIVYHASNMILCAHSDAGFLNELQSRSQAGAHIFLLEDVSMARSSPLPKSSNLLWHLLPNQNLLPSSSLHAKMIPHRQTLIDMGWPQPKSPIQTNNSTAAGVVNNTIVLRRSKMMDMRLWWLHCWVSQDQF
jgi:hypothetical protein